jgi:hypothetical protein
MSRQFAADPANKYFPEVFEDLMELVPAIRAKNPGMAPNEILATAYKRAIWTNEAVRAKVLAEQQQQTAQQQTQAQQQASQKAAAAAISLTGAPGSGPAAAIQDVPSATLREELERQFGGSRV